MIQASNVHIRSPRLFKAAFLLPHATSKTTRVKAAVSIDTEPSCALKYGADFLGMILWPKTKRYVPPHIARSIVESVKKERGIGFDRLPKVVGIFVEENADQITRIAEETAIDIVQLHGANARKALPDLNPDLPKTYVLEVDGNGRVVNGMEELPASVEFVLVDGMKGGSGVRIPLNTLSLPEWIDDRDVVRFGWFLAGGLNPENVAEALGELKQRGLRPIGVDVSSGVCDESGQSKSHQKMKQFLNQAKRS